MSNRRRSDRYAVTLPVVIKGARGSENTLTANVSAHGIAVFSERPFPVRQYVELELRLPPEGAVVSVTAMVARTTEALEDRAGLKHPGVAFDFYLFDTKGRWAWRAFLDRLRTVGAPTVPAVRAAPSGPPASPGAPAVTAAVPGRSGPLVVRSPIQAVMGRPAEPDDGEVTREDDGDNMAAFLVKPRDVGRLWGFYRTELGSMRVRIETPVLKPVGSAVEVVVVHPITREEWALRGQVLVSSETGRGRGPMLEVALVELSEEERQGFRRFISSGVPEGAGGEPPRPGDEIATQEVRRAGLDPLPEAREEVPIAPSSIGPDAARATADEIEEEFRRMAEARRSAAPPPPSREGPRAPSVVAEARESLRAIVEVMSPDLVGTVAEQQLAPARATSLRGGAEEASSRGRASEDAGPRGRGGAEEASSRGRASEDAGLRGRGGAEEASSRGRASEDAGLRGRAVAEDASLRGRVADDASSRTRSSGDAGPRGRALDDAAVRVRPSDAAGSRSRPSDDAAPRARTSDEAPRPSVEAVARDVRASLAAGRLPPLPPGAHALPSPVREADARKTLAPPDPHTTQETTAQPAEPTVTAARLPEARETEPWVSAVAADASARGASAPAPQRPDLPPQAPTLARPDTGLQPLVSAPSLARGPASSGAPPPATGVGRIAARNELLGAEPARAPQRSDSMTEADGPPARGRLDGPLPGLPGRGAEPLDPAGASRASEPRTRSEAAADDPSSLRGKHPAASAVALRGLADEPAPAAERRHAAATDPAPTPAEESRAAAAMPSSPPAASEPPVSMEFLDTQESLEIALGLRPPPNAPARTAGQPHADHAGTEPLVGAARGALAGPEPGASGSRADHAGTEPLVGAARGALAGPEPGASGSRADHAGTEPLVNVARPDHAGTEPLVASARGAPARSDQASTDPAVASTVAARSDDARADVTAPRPSRPDHGRTEPLVATQSARADVAPTAPRVPTAADIAPAPRVHASTSDVAPTSPRVHASASDVAPTSPRVHASASDVAPTSPRVPTSADVAPTTPRVRAASITERDFEDPASARGPRVPLDAPRPDVAPRVPTGDLVLTPPPVVPEPLQRPARPARGLDIAERLASVEAPLEGFEPISPVVAPPPRLSSSDPDPSRPIALPPARKGSALVEIVPASVFAAMPAPFDPIVSPPSEARTPAPLRARNPAAPITSDLLVPATPSSEPPPPPPHELDLPILAEALLAAPSTDVAPSSLSGEESAEVIDLLPIEPTAPRAVDPQRRTDPAPAARFDDDGSASSSSGIFVQPVPEGLDDDTLNPERTEDEPPRPPPSRMLFAAFFDEYRTARPGTATVAAHSPIASPPASSAAAASGAAAASSAAAASPAARSATVGASAATSGASAASPAISGASAASPATSGASAGTPSPAVADRPRGLSARPIPPPPPPEDVGFDDDETSDGHDVLPPLPLRSAQPPAAPRAPTRAAEPLPQVERREGPRAPSLSQTSEDAGRDPRASDDSGRSARASDDAGRGARASDDAGRSARASDDAGRSARASDDAGRGARASDDTGRGARGSDDAGRGARASDDAPLPRAPLRPSDGPSGPDRGAGRSAPRSSRNAASESAPQSAHRALSTAGSDPALDRDIALARARVVRSPGSVTACYQLGRLLLRRGSSDSLAEATEQLHRAVELEPSHPGAHLAAAELAARQGRFDAAAEHLQRARRLGYRIDDRLEKLVADGRRSS